MIKVKIILDSINEENSRLTTIIIKCPQSFSHEFMKHKMFIKNIGNFKQDTILTTIESVEKDMSLLKNIGKKTKKIEKIAHDLKFKVTQMWLNRAKKVENEAKKLINLGMHKQIANKILEPYVFNTILITGTQKSYSDFFLLAEKRQKIKEMQILANEIILIYKNNKPVLLPEGSWHLPYITQGDLDIINFDDYNQCMDILCKISAVRCLKMNYFNFSSNSHFDIGLELDVYNKMIESFPVNISFTEHIAMSSISNKQMESSFDSWIKYRDTLSGKFRKKYIG